MVRKLAFLLANILWFECSVNAQSEVVDTPREAWAYYTLNQSPSRTAVVRFCGFLDGKSGVATPEWWSNAFGDLVEGNFKRMKNLAKNANVATRNCTVNASNDGLAIQLKNDEVITLDPKSLNFEEHGFLQSRVAFHLREELFVVNKVDMVYPYELVKVDTVSREIKWKIKVNTLPIVSGQSEHFVDVRASKNEALIFGIVFPFAYVSIIDLESGKLKADFAWEATVKSGRLFESTDKPNLPKIEK